MSERGGAFALGGNDLKALSLGKPGGAFGVPCINRYGVSSELAGGGSFGEGSFGGTFHGSGMFRSLVFWRFGIGFGGGPPSLITLRGCPLVPENFPTGFTCGPPLLWMALG